MDNLFYALKLARSRNIGNIGFKYLIFLYKTPKKALESLKSMDYKWRDKKIILAEDKLIEKEIIETKKLGAVFLVKDDIDYPNNLLSIAAPPILIAKGNVDLLKRSCFTVVGTRHPSINGLNFTKEIVRDLCIDKTVVSGLALGIDTEAHKNSLNNGTVAVIAGGIDNFYPKQNILLQSAIEKKGLVLTSQPIGVTPSSKMFHYRNSIMAGLGISTLVMESTGDSGAISTANYAMKYDRIVFAVPGHPYDSKYEGNNFLLKKGAFPLTNISDINNILSTRQVVMESQTLFTKIEKRHLKNLLKLLSVAPTPMGQIILKSSMPLPEIMSSLSELELMDAVKINLDNTVILKDNNFQL